MDDTPARIAEVIEEVLAAHAQRPGALLPMLHAIQDSLGYIPAEAVPRLASALNQSRAEIHGVITYYPHFRQTRPARHIVQVCRAEACQAVGANDLIKEIGKTLRCGLHESSPDNAVALEPVYCLGQCAVGPAVMVDGQLHARMTPERFQQLASTMEGGK